MNVTSRTVTLPAMILFALSVGTQMAEAGKSKKKATGTLSVASTPWAQVWVDGKKVGSTPVVKKVLPVGQHQVVLVNEDLGVKKTYTTTIEKGTNAKIAVKLDEEAGDEESVTLTKGGKKKGQITVNTIPWTKVTVDGQKVGNTPLTKISVAPGVHEVRLVNDDADIDVKISVTVKAGKVESVVKNFQVTASASGEEGSLSVASTPWTQVWVDGQKVGNTPVVKHPIAPGKHTVKLVNEDADVQKNVTVTVKAGQDVKIVETF